MLIELFIFALLLIFIDRKYHFINPQEIIDDFSKHNYDYKSAIKKLNKMHFGAKKYDNIIGVFPFLWTYLFYYIIINVYHNTDNLLIKIVLILLLMPVFSVLREITHFTTHNVLTKNKKLGFWITDIFFQYPLFLGNMDNRYKRHTLLHHKYTCIKGKDPVINDLLDSGLKENMSSTDFIKLVLYPLTFRGLYQNIYGIAKNQFSMNYGLISVFMRNIVTVSILFLFIYNEYYQELIFLYLIPLLFIYPLFTWVTQLIEHRWLVPFDSSLDKVDIEMVVGRATEYSGIKGMLLSSFFLYYADRYHLAHSLVPQARWNYLYLIDTILKKTYPSIYMQNASGGLISPSKEYKYSALSELYKRVI